MKALLLSLLVACSAVSQSAPSVSVEGLISVIVIIENNAGFSTVGTSTMDSATGYSTNTVVQTSDGEWATLRFTIKDDGFGSVSHTQELVVSVLPTSTVHVKVSGLAQLEWSNTTFPGVYSLTGGSTNAYPWTHQYRYGYIWGGPPPVNDVTLSTSVPTEWSSAQSAVEYRVQLVMPGVTRFYTDFTPGFDISEGMLVGTHVSGSLLSYHAGAAPVDMTGVDSLGFNRLPSQGVNVRDLSWSATEPSILVLAPPVTPAVVPDLGIVAVDTANVVATYADPVGGGFMMTATPTWLVSQYISGYRTQLFRATASGIQASDWISW